MGWSIAIYVECFAWWFLRLILVYNFDTALYNDHKDFERFSISGEVKVNGIWKQVLTAPT